MGDRTVEVIVVPYDVERDDTPAAHGPRELLARGLLSALERHGVRAHVTEVPLRPGAATKAEKVAAIGRDVARAVALASSQPRFLLVLSGGCLAAVGVVAGLQRSSRRLRVVWVDAHGDFNTPESTSSGYWDGMALAAVCGRSLPEVHSAVELRPVDVRDVIHLAGRDFDPPETEDFRRLNLRLVPPAEVGGAECLRRLDAVPQPSEGGTGQPDLYLHVDLDGLDPADAPAVGHPCPGGPTLAAVLACLQAMPVPAAMTLSALSFEKADAREAERTLETCRKLLDGFLARWTMPVLDRG